MDGSLTPWRFATSDTGALSASSNIRTICSSVNLARFIFAPPLRGAIVSNYSWPENPRTGQDVDDWVHSYNHDRTHSGKHCFGKTPWQTFLDSKAIALEKQLDRTMPTTSLPA